MPYGFLKSDMFSFVSKFLSKNTTVISDEEQNASRFIQKWYNNYKNYDEDDDWEKGTYIRMMMMNYDVSDILEYPERARNKIKLYSPKPIKPVGKFEKKSEVRKWIMDNMDIEDIYLVGY